jgi:hypothetical protein
VPRPSAVSGEPADLGLNDDFRDLLNELLAAGARFVVVGAHAMAVHGVPRATGDLDVWIHPEPANAERVWAALQRFGAPVGQLGIAREDLATPGMVVQIGVPPRRIDLLTELSGLDFEGAWRNRTARSIGSLEVPFLGRDDLIRNKRASGRPKDLADLEILEK